MVLGRSRTRECRPIQTAEKFSDDGRSLLQLSECLRMITYSTFQESFKQENISFDQNIKMEFTKKPIKFCSWCITLHGAETWTQIETEEIMRELWSALHQGKKIKRVDSVSLKIFSKGWSRKGQAWLLFDAVT